jgi:hypothetical protein
MTLDLSPRRTEAILQGIKRKEITGTMHALEPMFTPLFTIEGHDFWATAARQWMREQREQVNRIQRKDKYE